jgi:hypothetical protein
LLPSGLVVAVGLGRKRRHIVGRSRDSPVRSLEGGELVGCVKRAHVIQGRHAKDWLTVLSTCALRKQAWIARLVAIHVDLLRIARIRRLKVLQVEAWHVGL